MGIKLLGVSESIGFFNKNVPDDVKAMLALVDVTVYCGNYFYDVFLGECQEDGNDLNRHTRIYNMEPRETTYRHRLKEIIGWARDGMVTCNEEDYV